ncbi:MAG TPA: PfkB family carbohydrate kinase [Bryobacteraceae bacterium]
MRIIAIGEILWDAFGDTERLGGASFNFAVQARRLGHDVIFLSAVGDDDRGRRALHAVEEFGLPTRFVRTLPGSATGTVSVTVDAAGQPDFVIHRPAAYDCIELGREDFEEIAAFEPGWIYFGTLHQMNPRAKLTTGRLVDSCGGAQRFYDVNLRANSYTPELVCELMRQADIVKLNEDEVATAARFIGCAGAGIEEFCRFGLERCGWDSVCVTRGARGCALLVEGVYVEAPGYPVDVSDTVGAGDAFAAAFVHGMGQGWRPAEIGDFANRVGALVASRPGALPEWTMEECRSLHRSAV